MIGSRDSNVEFSRKRPGTTTAHESARTEGVSENPPFGALASVWLKNRTMQTRVVHTRPRHSQIGGVRAFIISVTGGWRGGMDAWITSPSSICMHAREKKSLRRTGAVEYRIYTRALETILAGVHETSPGGGLR